MEDNAPALAFLTETQRAGAGEWTPDRRLVLRFEPGSAVPLAQLGWRDPDGAESVVGFDPGMTTFTGTRIAADGTFSAWRGRLAERLTDRPGHRFRVDGGEGAHDDLRLLIEDGGGPAVRATWADREGGGGAIVLRTTDPGSAGEVTRKVREVEADDEFRANGEVAVNLLDATHDKWLSRLDTDRLEFTMAEPVRVRRYVLVSANDFSDRDPRDWVLKGSADGRTWVTLDTRAGEFFPERHFARDYHVTGSAADTPYPHLRLEITGNHGAHEIQLERVRFFSEGRTYEAFTGHRYAAGGASSPYAGVAGGSASGAPGTVEDWRSFLAEYSADMLRVLNEDELGHTTEEQGSAPWLGYDGATEERIADLEMRLGLRLPPSYRSFLAASDGWAKIGPFMYELRSTATVGWLDDLRDEAVYDEANMKDDGLVGPLLLVSGEGDAQDWLLDAGDVSPDGEWAARVWATWFPGPAERYASFADLVAAERASFERLSGANGSPVRAAGAEELLAQGRRAALKGRVDDALDAFRRAEEKGSGAAAYLKAVLSAFLDVRTAHRRLPGLLHRPHVVAEVGMEQITSEAVPLFLRSAGLDEPGGAAQAVRALGRTVPGLRVPSTGPEWDRWIADHPAPEPPAFERALGRARELASRDDTDGAWAVIEEALPAWYPVSPNRIAPVVLLTDPVLRRVVTPRRAREAVFTPRGAHASA
ncbi:SMI1/KNR4 family protein [Nocardiopsis sediminis]|uniref:SMI1/KNR4 family protein n=1 Tax=Nocardiopsis sediminis TaxID=1778267 RepID=A0ABV8FPZ8_9ACTN